MAAILNFNLFWRETVERLRGSRYFCIECGQVYHPANFYAFIRKCTPHSHIRPTITSAGKIYAYVFSRVYLFVCLSVHPSDYLKSNERILPKVCHEPRNNRLDFVDYSDYDPDPETDYDPDPIRIERICITLFSRIRITIINFGGGLQSQTDCLVIYCYCTALY